MQFLTGVRKEDINSVAFTSTAGILLMENRLSILMLFAEGEEPYPAMTVPMP